MREGGLTLTSEFALKCRRGGRVLGANNSFDVSKALSVSVAILDRSGLIVAVNEAWKNFGRQYGLRLSNFGVGVNYLRYCEFGASDSLQLLEDLSDLLAGKLKPHHANLSLPFADRTALVLSDRASALRAQAVRRRPPARRSNSIFPLPGDCPRRAVWYLREREAQAQGRFGCSG